MLPIPYDKRSVDDHNEIHTFPDPASPRVPDTYIETLLGNDVEIPSQTASECSLQTKLPYEKTDIVSSFHKGTYSQSSL